MDKIYVVYWSQSGNTQAMAEAIGKAIVTRKKRKNCSKNWKNAKMCIWGFFVREEIFYKWLFVHKNSEGAIRKMPEVQMTKKFTKLLDIFLMKTLSAMSVYMQRVPYPQAQQYKFHIYRRTLWTVTHIFLTKKDNWKKYLHLMRIYDIFILVEKKSV